MKWIEIFLYIFELDAKTAIGFLFWNNFILAILIFGYYYYHSKFSKAENVKWYGYAKVLQMIAWFLLFLRGSIFDVFSVNMGNTILFFGFYTESLVMLSIVRHKKKWINIYQLFITIFMIAVFNFFELAFQQPHLRVFLASISVFFILLLPIMYYIFDKRSTSFRKFLGVCYFILLVLLLPRAGYSLVETETTIFSNNFIQISTFILLSLIVPTGGTGFLLLAKEEVDLYLEKMANLDPLTEILNRRFFLKQAQAFFSRAKKNNEPVSILFLDIDKFKLVNDHYGHTFGDEVLVHFSKRILESIRSADLCSRYGGEEFVIYLLNANYKVAQNVAKRIMNNIKVKDFENAPEFKYTTSIGVFSAIPNEKDEVAQFIDKADKALYAAKESGRNRVTLFEDLS